MYINVVQSQIATSRHIHKVINTKGPAKKGKPWEINTKPSFYAFECLTSHLNLERMEKCLQKTHYVLQQIVWALSLQARKISTLVTFCQKHTEREMVNFHMIHFFFGSWLMTPQVELHGTQWGKKCCLDIQLKISEVNQICIHSLVTVWRGGIHHLRCTCQMLCSVGSKLQKQSLKLPRINTVQKCIESHQYSAHCTTRSITIPENNPNMCGNSERIDCMRTLDWAHGVCTCISWLLLPTWHLLSWAGSHLFHNMFHYNFMISDSGRNWAL